MSNNHRAGGSKICLGGSRNIDPMSTMALVIRGARPKQFRNGGHVVKHDQLHARWTRDWKRNDPPLEPDKLIERLGRRLVQDLSYIWPILRTDIAGDFTSEKCRSITIARDTHRQ